MCTNKLICTGWTQLVQLLCSSDKLFVSGQRGFDSLSLGRRYGAHATAFTHTILSSPVAGNQKPIFKCYIKCQKSKNS